MFDYQMLKERMKALRIRQYDIAKETQKSRATISASFKGKREFMQTEILTISKLLKIKDNEIGTYFFKLKLKKT